jgi:hypothetical protein
LEERIMPGHETTHTPPTELEGWMEEVLREVDRRMEGWWQRVLDELERKRERGRVPDGEEERTLTPTERAASWRTGRPLKGSIWYPPEDTDGRGWLAGDDNFIVAYGCSWTPEVMAILTSTVTGEVYMGHPLRSPKASATAGQSHLWAVEFLNIDPGKYRLSLFACPGKKLAERVVDLKKKPPTHGLTFTCPTGNPPHVCFSYVATGTAGNSGNATGTMTDTATQEQFNGSQLTGGPNWSLQFSNLKIGHTYDLSVTVGGENGSVKGIVVDRCV